RLVMRVDAGDKAAPTKTDQTQLANERDVSHVHARPECKNRYEDRTPSWGNAVRKKSNACKALSLTGRSTRNQFGTCKSDGFSSSDFSVDRKVGIVSAARVRSVHSPKV